MAAAVGARPIRREAGSAETGHAAALPKMIEEATVVDAYGVSEQSTGVYTRITSPFSVLVQGPRSRRRGENRPDAP
jgi:hypothetical protein